MIFQVLKIFLTFCMDQQYYVCRHEIQSVDLKYYNDLLIGVCVSLYSPWFTAQINEGVSLN
jgi:hypothetical protein